MKLKKISLGILSCLSLMTIVHANEVTLSTNKPMEVSYRIAHQNPGQKVVLGSEVSMVLRDNFTVPINLDGFKWAGLVPTKLDGHVLPPGVNEFNQKDQCSMTTDKNKTHGRLEFDVDAHQARCATKGGILG